ncbi:MAG: alkaline phosphatase family protein [Spirochaetia bacterium]|nr:alkaline phosphatase family protein [Spirochaetia bacterium]
MRFGWAGILTTLLLFQWGMAESSSFRIAFGSCNKESKDQSYWRVIAEKNPALWIWLGDNIYGDTTNMDVMRAKYQLVKTNADYAAFISKVPVIGSWDDHDFGQNDGGREYPVRPQSQAACLDFLGVPKTHPVWKQEGVYQTYEYVFGKIKIRVVLLDARYHRDPPGPDGDMLGKTQWLWLEKTLRESRADLHLIGSGVQVVSEEHRFEKWGNFPKSRERLFSLLKNVKRPIVLSGDRHFGELSMEVIPGTKKKVYDFTSSGLTHSVKPRTEVNQHRLGENVHFAKNFGLIDVSGSGSDVKVTLRLCDLTETNRGVAAFETELTW